jgi:integrase
MSSFPENPASGGWGPASMGPIPFADLAAELLRLYEFPLRAVATYRHMKNSLRIFAALLGPEGTTAHLTPDFIARLIASRPPGQSPYTVKAYLTNLKIVCNYCLANGYIARSPFQFRKNWIRCGEGKPKKHHSREEIARVLALMARDVERKTGWAQWRSRRLHALASTVAYTGLRRNEATHLRMTDVLLEERLILVVPTAGNRLKTSRSAQPVPIPDALAPILEAWLPHAQSDFAFPNTRRTGPWIGGAPGYKPLERMKRLGVRAGVEGFTFQSLRHSFATHAEYWGLSETMIQRILRHTSTRTQQHYRHADAANMRAAVGRIDFGPGPQPEERGS